MLTPDADVELEVVEEEKIYVVGGLVDRRPQKKRTARRFSASTPCFCLIRGGVEGQKLDASGQESDPSTGAFRRRLGGFKELQIWRVQRVFEPCVAFGDLKSGVHQV